MVAGIGLAIAGVALALLVRYQPELASAIVPGGSGLAPPSRDVESATIAQSAGAVTLPAPSEAPPSRDTVSIPLLALLQDTGSRPARGRRTVVTDVVLLPCSTPNPRADGSFLIPPHNPRHRTIVGLPHQPGESARGFVIPPLDPKRENQVPIQIIPIDSILAHTLRVPPHDPTGYNRVRPDSMACLPDSGAASQPPR